MTLIELGDVSAGSTASGPPTPPLSLARMRRYAAAGVTALCLLLLTGAQRPESNLMPLRWSGPVAQHAGFRITGNALYTFGTQVRAYDPETGRLRWTRPVNGDHNWIYTEIDGVTLLPGNVQEQAWTDPDGTTHREDMIAETVAVDAVTGAERWRRPGEIAGTVSGAVVLRSAGQEGMVATRAVRVHDGHELWSWTAPAPVPHWAVSATPGGAGALVTATTDGRIEVRGLTDGALVARGRVPWVPYRESDGAFTDLFVHDDTFLVARFTPAGVTFDGYALDSVKHLWSARGGRTYVGMSACGPAVCLGDEPRGLVARDPRSGAVRWRDRQWDNAHHLPGGRLLLNAGETGRTGLADAATGRLVADLGQRLTLTDFDTGRVLTLATVQDPPGAQVVYEATPDGRRVLRGLLSGDVTDCQLGGRYLACVTGGVLTVRAVG